MKVKRLGEDLYVIRPTWLTTLKSWSFVKPLAEVLIQIQSGGKVVTSLSQLSVIPCIYIVCTTDKREVL